MITTDYHIHSCNSCDQAALPVADLVRTAAARGIASYALTDHIHTPLNLPELEASRRDYEAVHPSADFHFGVEVSVVSQWELDQIAAGGHEGATYGLRSGGPAGAAPALALDEELIDRLGLELVVGGTHWPLYVAEVTPESMMADYHRQNMFLVTHPLVDIVAHPWWWMGAWKGDDGRYRTDPWLDDFRRIPQSMHEEFAAAALQHNTVIEINISAMLQNPTYPEAFAGQYLEYVGYLRGRGVRLSLGSDCHSASYGDIDFERAAAQLATVGLSGDELWRMPAREA